MKLSQALSGATFALSLAAATAAQAITITEIGDAGGTAGTAQFVGGAEVTEIRGNLGPSDSDFYRFSFSEATNFVVSNLRPDIEVNLAFDDFTLNLFNSALGTEASCGDCWFVASGGPTVIDTEIPAGDYFLQVVDTNLQGSLDLGDYSFNIGSGALQDGLTGPFAFENWALTNSPGNDGFVEQGLLPSNFTLFGGEARVSGTTDFTIEATADGTISFDWRYETDDFVTECDFNSSPLCDRDTFFDPAFFLLDGTETQLGFSDPDTGTQMVDILAGQIFGFRVATADGFGGRGSSEISNFSFTAFESDEVPTGDTPVAAIPEPTTLAVFGAGLLALAWTGRRRRRTV